VSVTRPVHDTIAGGLIGLAVGDALGSTVEFLNPAQIQSQHGTHHELIGGGAFNWRPGQGTDDTDLTLAVLDGYLKTVDKPSATLYSIASEMLSWYHTSPPDIGATTRVALRRLLDTFDPITSGLYNDRSCGNGSLMRALPTGLIRSDPGTRRRETAAISAITHAHPKCVDSCIAYNEIAAALLQGATPTDAIAAASQLDLEPTVRTALRIPGSVPVSELRTSGYVIDGLTCAVWAIQQTTSFEATLVALVNRGDDADTTGAIAGGLRGLIDGVTGIPFRWRQQLESTDRIADAVHGISRFRA
jgi:ADP-ribosyl-[dinitrogen reductase] hydrolase